MRIIGCDLHARQQTLAMLDTARGEVEKATLKREGHSVREFYSTLPRPVRVGIEATGSMQWFVNLMEELGIECLVGHPATIRAAEPRKQKHDRRDADLLLSLLVEERFPAIWLPTKELLDLRALLRHRHQWVCLRVKLQNALQAIALANGLRRGPSLWTHAGQHAIASLPLSPHAAYRRNELQAMYVKFKEEIEKLNRRVEQQARERFGARLLMTHPGVGPITALATEVFLGDPARFADSKELASYVGMIPREHSSGGRQRLGGLSKQGNPLLRFLWSEAVIHAVRRDPELKQFYRRKLIQKGLGKARAAVARKLGIRMWIMLRDGIEYSEFCRRGPSQTAGQLCYDADFSPYGQEMSHTERLQTGACPTNYKFTGYERDPETGLDYAFARYYSSRLGRFLSTDPLGGSIGNLQSHNAYAYVLNDPANLIDPTGMGDCGRNKRCVSGSGGSQDQGGSGDVPLDFFLTLIGVVNGDEFDLLVTALTPTDYIRQIDTSPHCLYDYDDYACKPDTWKPIYGNIGLLGLIGGGGSTETLTIVCDYHCGMIVGRDGKYTRYDGEPSKQTPLILVPFIDEPKLIVQVIPDYPFDPNNPTREGNISFQDTVAPGTGQCISNVASYFNNAKWTYSVGFLNSNSFVNDATVACGVKY